MLSAQWVKCLSHKSENQIPRIHVKSWAKWQPWRDERQRQMDPWKLGLQGKF